MADFQTRKHGTDKQVGRKFPVEEEGHRDDNENPVTFGTPLVDNENENEMEEFAHDKSKEEDENQRIEEQENDDRVEEQESKNELDEIKKDQVEADEKQKELDKDDQREVAISLVNDVIVDDDLVDEAKIDMLNEIKSEYNDSITLEDRIDINHEISILKDKVKLQRKGDIDKKRDELKDERTQKKKDHEREIKEQIQNAKKSRKLSKQLLAKGGKSIKTSSSKSQHTNKIDKDSATRLSLFLAKRGK